MVEICKVKRLPGGCEQVWGVRTQAVGRWHPWIGKAYIGCEAKVG